MIDARLSLDLGRRKASNVLGAVRGTRTSDSQDLCHEPALAEQCDDSSRVLFGRCVDGVERHLRSDRTFVRIVDPREAADLTATRLCVHALGIARLTNFEWCVDEDLD